MSVTGNRREKKPAAAGKAADKATITAAAVESIKDEIAAGNVAVEDLPKETAALVAAPAGTALPAATTDTPPQDDPQAGEKNQEPIVVKTREQLAAEKLINRDVFLKWYGKRPQTAKWVEPSEEQVDARIGKLMAERGIKPTNFVAIGKLSEEVAAQIASERSASGIDAQVAVDIAYLRAAQVELNNLSTHITTMLGELGAKVTTTRSTRKSSTATDGTPVTSENSGRKSEANWKEMNPKLIAYAKTLGLKDVVLVDTNTNTGYKGTFHVVAACADGRWEDCSYDPTTMAYKRLGTFHDRPFYWKTSEIKYSPEQMYHVLLQRQIPGVSIQARNVDKPFADFKIFQQAANG